VKKHVKAFKAIAAQVAHHHGFGFGQFMGEHGLQDFLLDEVSDDDGPAEIAAKALHRFCVEDGRFNGFLVGVETAIVFLNERMTRPENASQRAVAYQDLKSVLDGGGQISSIERWIESHYR
jgi:hypothetical protein